MYGAKYSVGIKNLLFSSLETKRLASRVKTVEGNVRDRYLKEFKILFGKIRPSVALTADGVGSMKWHFKLD